MKQLDFAKFVANHWTLLCTFPPDRFSPATHSVPYSRYQEKRTGSQHSRHPSLDAAWPLAHRRHRCRLLLRHQHRRVVHWQSLPRCRFSALLVFSRTKLRGLFRLCGKLHLWCFLLPHSSAEFSRRKFLRKFTAATGSFSLPASLTDHKSLPPHPVSSRKTFPSHHTSLAFICFLAGPLSRRKSPPSHLSLSQVPAHLLLARSLSFHRNTFRVQRLIDLYLIWITFRKLTDSGFHTQLNEHFFSTWKIWWWT